MLLFKAMPCCEIIVGEVVYSAEDESFDFEPRRGHDLSVLIQYLNLCFDSETGEAQGVWGFSPRQSWAVRRDEPPQSLPGKLLLLGDHESGRVQRLDTEIMWKSSFNPATEWFCMGNPQTGPSDVSVEFATNVIAVLWSDGGLKALWFRFRVTQ